MIDRKAIREMYCPFCEAIPGLPCRSKTGKVVAEHSDRALSYLRGRWPKWHDA